MNQNNNNVEDLVITSLNDNDNYDSTFVVNKLNKECIVNIIEDI